MLIFNTTGVRLRVGRGSSATWGEKRERLGCRLPLPLNKGHHPPRATAVDWSKQSAGTQFF